MSTTDYSNVYIYSNYFRRANLGSSNSGTQANRQLRIYMDE